MALLIRTQLLLFFGAGYHAIFDRQTCSLWRHRVHASWMYMAKLAAAKEFAYMKALKDRSRLGKSGWFRRNCMKLCVREPFTIMFVSLLRIYYLHLKLFIYLCICLYLHSVFIHSFAHMWTTKPTSPCRVAFGDSFQCENSKWEHRLIPDTSRMKDFLYRAPSIRIATSWSCPLLGSSETAFVFYKCVNMFWTATQYKQQFKLNMLLLLLLWFVGCWLLVVGCWLFLFVCFLFESHVQAGTQGITTVPKVHATPLFQIRSLQHPHQAATKRVVLPPNFETSCQRWYCIDPDSKVGWFPDLYVGFQASPIRTNPCNPEMAFRILPLKGLSVWCWSRY